MKTVSKRLYMPPILVKQASLRNVTARGSYTGGKGEGNYRNIERRQIFNFIRNLIQRYRNRF